MSLRIETLDPNWRPLAFHVLKVLTDKAVENRDHEAALELRRIEREMKGVGDGTDR